LGQVVIARSSADSVDVASVYGTIVHACIEAVKTSGEIAVACIAGSSRLYFLNRATKLNFESDEQLLERVALMTLLLDYPSVLGRVLAASSSNGCDGFLAQAGVLGVIRHTAAFVGEERPSKVCKLYANVAVDAWYHDMNPCCRIGFPSCESICRG
jgi:hypothetical protein